MKNIQSYIHTIILVILLSAVCFGQASYDSVAAFTAKTTISLTDIFPFQTKVTNKYTWRKITGASMWDRITDTTEARITTLLNASNSWNGINNFDGATFNSGSHGKVLFNGDSVVCTTQMFTHGIQRTQASSMIGRFDVPFFNIYSKTFTIVNPGGNDSAQVSYDDSTITFSKNISMPNLTITGTVNMDSGTVFNTFVLGIDAYSPITVADTIITFPVGQVPIAAFILPGNLTDGISRITGTAFTNGQIIVLRNATVPYTILLKDRVGGDDNLYLEGNFTMGYNDIITLMCIAEEPALAWVEVSRSNN
jgi:hypothetical protein